MTEFNPGERLRAAKLNKFAADRSRFITDVAEPGVFVRRSGQWVETTNVITPEDYGAVGDGVNDDTAAVNAALAASGVIQLRAQRTYLVRDLILGTLQQIIGNGAILKAAPGARWVIRMEGYRPQVHNIEIDDNNIVLPRRTTLSSAASAGDNTITVNNTAGIELAMAVFIEYGYGRWHRTLITGIAGNVLTLERAVPAGESADAGRRVWAIHGAIWLTNNARYFVVENVLFRSCYGSVVAKSSNFATAVAASLGRLVGLVSYGSQMFGLAIHRNCADFIVEQCEFRSTAAAVTSATGDGTTDTFALPENVYRIGISSDLTVTVGGVAQTYATDYTLPDARTVEFATSPAAGAAISFIQNVRGIVGFWGDNAPGGILNGGHRISASFLGPYDGVNLVDAELYVFESGFVDSIAGDGVRLEGSARSTSFDGFASLFCAKNCVHATAGSTVLSVAFDGLRTTRWPAAAQLAGVLGEVIRVEAGSSLSVSAASWGGDKSLAGGGTFAAPGAYIVDFNTGETALAAGASIFAAGGATAATEENGVVVAAPWPLIVIKMVAYCAAAPGAGQSNTYTFRAIGAATAATTTITGAGVFAGTWVGRVALVEGSAMAFKIDAGAAATATRHRGFALCIPA